MKRTCLLFAGACAAALTATAQVGLELLDNGDFSKTDEKGWAVGWPQFSRVSGLFMREKNGLQEAKRKS